MLYVSKTYNFLFIIFTLVFLMPKAVKAQQDPNFTQYMYNTMTINPAYAGTRDVWSTGLLFRSQWTGIDGAPITGTFSTHSPLKDGTMGLGMNIIHDRIGPEQDTYVNGNYSYILQLDRYTNFSMGISAGAHFRDVNFNELNIYNPGDPNFENIRNQISPQVGLGFQLYSEKYYVGLSSPFLLRTRHFEDGGSQNSRIRDEIHYYFTAGYVFDLSRNIQFKPSVLTRVVQGAPTRIDISANFLFYEKFTLGAEIGRAHV